jgi:hypothetical protein
MDWACPRTWMSSLGGSKDLGYGGLAHTTRPQSARTPPLINPRHTATRVSSNAGPTGWGSNQPPTREGKEKHHGTRLGRPWNSRTLMSWLNVMQIRMFVSNGGGHVVPCSRELGGPAGRSSRCHAEDVPRWAVGGQIERASQARSLRPQFWLCSDGSRNFRVGGTLMGLPRHRSPGLEARRPHRTPIETLPTFVGPRQRDWAIDDAA